MVLETRWFKLFIGRAFWLPGAPFGARLMWLPRPDLAGPHKFAPIPSRLDIDFSFVGCDRDRLFRPICINYQFVNR